MNARWVRRAVVAAVVSVIATLLAGCAPVDNPDHDVAAPLAFTVVGGAPIVRTCVPMTVTSMTIIAYSSLSDVDGTDVWEADGTASMPAAHEFVMGTAVHGMSVDENARKQYLLGQFALDMEVIDSRGNDRETFSYFDTGELHKGAWLNGDGDPVSAPCRASTCKSTPKSCDERWDSTAAARRLTPETTPEEIPASAPRIDDQTASGAISFTRIGGIVYAQLCAARVVDTQFFSEAIGSDPSNGWVDIEIASTTKPRKFPAGTRWRVGQELPGETITADSGSHPNLSEGTYRIELESLIGADTVAKVTGEFRGSELGGGRWVDSAGKLEASACATYDASHPGK